MFLMIGFCLVFLSCAEFRLRVKEIHNKFFHVQVGNKLSPAIAPAAP